MSRKGHTGWPEAGDMHKRPVEAPLNTRPATGWPEVDGVLPLEEAVERQMKRNQRTLAPEEGADTLAEVRIPRLDDDRDLDGFGPV